MIKYKRIILFLTAIFILHTSAASINSVTITAATLKALPHCLHYRIRGVCVWFSPTQGINTTPYINQYLPDVVVSVFNKPGEDAWFEMNASIDQAGKLAEQKITATFTRFSAGYGQHSFSNEREQQVFFKEADVIGNPALTTLNNPAFLPSTAIPLMPYYQSMLDSVLWRGFPLLKHFPPEEFYAVVADIRHHVGNVIIDWGGIYPHEGKIATSNDAKAAAVIAQRAGDLITSSNPITLGHIYQPLPEQCGRECTASPIRENSSQTQFQLIYPVESSTCDYFGKTIRYGDDIEQKTHGAYVWVIWRFYHGCRDGNGQFVKKIIFN